MNYNYYIADVFTNQAFNGAQVAVFPNADGLNNQQMAMVARELNLSETVFLFKNELAEDSRQMKTFSPYRELDYTGHPIIAAAFVSASCGEIKLTQQFAPFNFEQNAGLVNVNITNIDGKPGLIQYTRQVEPLVDYYTPTEGELASFLGIEEQYIDNKKYSTRLVSCGFPYLVVPVFYYETLKKAKFNFSAWSQSIAPQTSAQEILLVSPKTPVQGSDFSVRLLGPNIGIHDDPPVGSAMAAFASFLCSFDHMRTGTYTFAVDRGDEKIRRSLINLEMDHKGEDALTIRIGGEAVMVAEGVMHIP